MAFLCTVHNYDVARAADSMHERSSSEHFAIKGVDEPLPFVPLLHKAPTQGRHEWKLTRDGLLPFFFLFLFSKYIFPASHDLRIVCCANMFYMVHIYHGIICALAQRHTEVGRWLASVKTDA